MSKDVLFSILCIAVAKMLFSTISLTSLSLSIFLFLIPTTLFHSPTSSLYVYASLCAYLCQYNLQALHQHFL